MGICLDLLILSNMLLKRPEQCDAIVGFFPLMKMWQPMKQNRQENANVIMSHHVYFHFCMGWRHSHRSP